MFPPTLLSGSNRFSIALKKEQSTVKASSFVNYDYDYMRLLKSSRKMANKQGVI